MLTTTSRSTKPGARTSMWQRPWHRVRLCTRTTALTLLALATLGPLTACWSATAHAAEEATRTRPEPGKLSFLRLYTGPDGVSHFAQETMQLEPRGTEGMEAALASHRLGDAPNALIAQLKAGTTEDWHTTPRRQLMICLRGLVEVTASDGQTRRVKPGEFVLLEDLSGKGHITHAAGTEDHVALALPIADDILRRK